MNDSTLSERFCQILQEQKLKKVQFAKTLGISANYVSLLAGGKKNTISEPLAKLIESTYGYRAEWILTGKPPIHPNSAFPGLQEDTINRVRKMNETELRAVAAFIHSLEEFDQHQ